MGELEIEFIFGINLITFINLEEDELKKKKKNFLNMFLNFPVHHTG